VNSAEEHRNLWQLRLKPEIFPQRQAETLFRSLDLFGASATTEVTALIDNLLSLAHSVISYFHSCSHLQGITFSLG